SPPRAAPRPETLTLRDHVHPVGADDHRSRGCRPQDVGTLGHPAGGDPAGIRRHPPSCDRSLGRFAPHGPGARLAPVRIAVCTVSLPEWTPEEAVAEVAALGFDGIEWRVADDPATDDPPDFWRGNRCTLPASSLARDAPRIRELTRDAGLEVPAIGPYARCDDLDAVERLMRGAAALGAPRMRVQVGAPGPEGYRETFARRRDEFRAVADLALQHGVQALLELHHQTIIASASAAARFLDGIDPRAVGVIHDVGNMLREGYEFDPWSL